MNNIKLWAKNEMQFESLVHTTRIFSNYDIMEFGIDKYAMLIRKQGRFKGSQGIKMPKKHTMKAVGKKTVLSISKYYRQMK